MIRYRIQPTERAEMDLDAAYLWRSGLVGPEEAQRWFRQLIAATMSLETMPRRGESIDIYEIEGDVRRIVFGRGAGAYLIVYRIFDPHEDETEGLVQIVRVHRGALPEPQNPNNDSG